MSYLTLRDVLAMPVVRSAGPVVRAGEQELDRRVRWVHATELADIAPLLRGDDLVLTTGIGLPEADAGLAAFARSLAEVGAAGLLVELGRRWQEDPPGALVSASEQCALPLVTLAREVRFAAITQAVGERVMDEQLAEMREAERVHETFTELSLDEARPSEILAAVQHLSGAAVVLENHQHRVLDYLAGPADVAGFLDDWPARSRSVDLVGRTTWDEQLGWLVTRLGRREHGWGRLVLESPTRPTQGLVAVAERGAASLAMHRLHDRDRDNLTRRTHHELLVALRDGNASDDVRRRCELAGFRVARRRFLGLTVRPRVASTRPSTPSRRTPLDDVLAAVVHAAHEAGVPALVCEMDHDVRVLLSLAASASQTVTVDRLAATVAGRHPVVIGVGRAVDQLGAAEQTLGEAQQVTDAVRPGSGDQVVHRLEDVHLRGLLTLFRDDERLRSYVRRQLDALRTHDHEHDAGLLDSLRALLNHPGSKSEAATSLHLSRPAFYARLAKIEKVIGARLDDPDIRVSLHVALVAEELERGN